MMRVLNYELPDTLYYSKEHEWLKVEGTETVVGITDYAQKQLHEIVYVEVQKVGASIEQFKTMGTVESVKSVSDLYAPVSGRITKVNEELSESPELLNQDPYGKGWLVKIDPKELDKDLKKLMNAQQYADYVKRMEK
jgi:glycine cleavage system H protein